MIEVKNVSKRYGDFYAVRNVSFNVRDGEIVGFLGRNGAGKTTTMNMITGFIEPSNGQILVNGFDVDAKPKKVKKLIGYMPEGVPLYPDLTVKEFISYMADLKLIPHKKKKDAVEKAIMSTGLDKVRNRLTRNLSRGFKQRVSMAGAIVGEPEILILDEPTVGLDPKQVKEIRELIKSFRKNHTVILSSHILSEVSQICEKVIIIDKGEIIAVDTPENLEKQTQTEQVLKITVEDPNNNFENTFGNLDYIKSVTLEKTNEDQTKLYVLSINDKYKDDNTVMKNIAIKCAENDILNLGIKKEEQSLEDAFLKLIEERPEMSYSEITQMQRKHELDELRQQKEEKKELKEIKKEQKSKAKEEKKDNSKEDEKDKEIKEENIDSEEISENAKNTKDNNKKEEKNDKKKNEKKGGNE